MERDRNAKKGDNEKEKGEKKKTPAGGAKGRPERGGGPARAELMRRRRLGEVPPQPLDRVPFFFVF